MYLCKNKKVLRAVKISLLVNLLYCFDSLAEDEVAREQQVKALEEKLELLEREIEKLKPTSEMAADEETRYGKDVSPQEVIERTKESTEPTVSAGEARVKLSISGQANRAVNIADDGKSTEAYFVDNDVSNSRFRIYGVAVLNNDLSFGGGTEIGISPNNSSDVSQTNEESRDNIDLRRVEVALSSQRVGTFWLGKGHAASDDTAEYDLSGVDVIMYSGVADIVGGLQFRLKDGTLTDVRVDSAFFNFDGLGRVNRLRYDSPNFGPGLQVSASVVSQRRYDLVLSLGGDFGEWSGVRAGSVTLLGALAYSDTKQAGTDYRVNGSFSLLHDKGFNATLSAGQDEKKDSKNPTNFYAKVGWMGALNPLGDIGFGLDYTRTKNQSAAGDKGDSVAFAVVQHVKDYGAEFYGQLRRFSLDRSAAAAVDDITVFTMGARVKF